MKFKDLTQKWKFLIVILSTLTILFTLAIAGVSVFLGTYRKNNADIRAALKKDDSELIGQRFKIVRNMKDDVDVNIYMPADVSAEKRPVVFNIHGGGFVGGDADALDTQSDRIANEWNMIVVTINYTKADVKPVSYGAQEISDTVLYFMDNAETYNADVAKYHIMGYSAGAYYAAEAVRLLKESGLDIHSLILCYPWCTGLPTDALNEDWPKTLFVFAGQDPISQRAKHYAEDMENAGIEVEIIEYEGAVHSFIESNNPEGLSDPSDNMETVKNAAQEALAREAENAIKEWLE